MTPQQFIDSQIGKQIDYDGAFGFQCVDWARYYIANYWQKPQSGLVVGAKDFFEQFPLGTGDWAERITNDVNDPNCIPLPGDMVVFGGTSFNQYGHVSICYSANSNDFVSADQNWAGHQEAVKLITHTYNASGGFGSVLGWIRPKDNSNNNQTINNNNMSQQTYEYVKQGISDVFMDTKYNVIPDAQPIGGDGLGWGAERTKIHANIDQGGQDPATAVRMLMDGYLNYHLLMMDQIRISANEKDVVDATVLNQNGTITGLNNQISTLTTEKSDLQTELDTANKTSKQEEDNLNNQIKELKDQIELLQKNLNVTEKIVYQTDEATKKENADLRVENIDLKNQIMVLKSDKIFSFNQFFIGISRNINKTINEKKLVAYLTYALTFIAIELINYFVVKSPALGYIATAVLIPILKKEQAKVTPELDPNITTQIDENITKVEAKLPGNTQL
jgi:hypothetical protein